MTLVALLANQPPPPKPWPMKAFRLLYQNKPFTMSSRASSRSSRSRQRQRQRMQLDRGYYEGRCESYPFDECSSAGGDDSSLVLRRRAGCRPSSSNNNNNGDGRPGRGLLEAFSCLCIGSGDANDYIDESDENDTSTTNELYHNNFEPKMKNATSPRDVTKLAQPVACMAGQERGAVLERPHPTRRNASFPASRFVFRPVSDEETTVTGFESTISRGWEI